MGCVVIYSVVSTGAIGKIISAFRFVVLLVIKVKIMYYGYMLFNSLFVFLQGKIKRVDPVLYHILKGKTEREKEKNLSEHEKERDRKG